MQIVDRNKIGSKLKYSAYETSYYSYTKRQHQSLKTK